MKIFNNIWILAIIFLTSCTGKIEGNAIVEIDLSKCNVEDLQLDKFQSEKLESNDSSILGDITSVVIRNENITMLSRGVAYTFNLTNGSFIRKFGFRKDSEWIFERDNIFGIFNFNTKEIAEFDANGKLLSTYKFENRADGLSPCCMLPISDGTYIAVNAYEGTQPESPQYGIVKFSKKNGIFNFEKIYQTPRIGNPYTQNRYVLSPDGKLYCTQQFNSKIYCVDENEVKEEYNLRFGEFGVPDSIVQQGYMPALRWTQENPGFTGYVTYCYKLKDYLIFAAFIKGDFSLVVYSLMDKQCNAYRLKVNDKDYIQQVIAYGDNEIFLFKGVKYVYDENPEIIAVKYSSIGIK